MGQWSNDRVLSIAGSKNVHTMMLRGLWGFCRRCKLVLAELKRRALRPDIFGLIGLAWHGAHVCMLLHLNRIQITPTMTHSRKCVRQPSSFKLSRRFSIHID